MPEARTFPTITREEAVNRLRGAFLGITDEENCLCKVAAERGLFCSGFQRYSDDDLRQRYWWIVRKRPEITRQELETLANDWQLAQQDVRNLPLACDVQSRLHDTCRGWNDFTDQQLAAAVREVLGEEVVVGSY